jgi:hypothetical protein
VCAFVPVRVCISVESKAHHGERRGHRCAQAYSLIACYGFCRAKVEEIGLLNTVVVRW